MIERPAQMRYLLLLDYDGTLTPIKDHPKLARLSPARKLFLRRLARRPGIKMALISGRELADLKKQAGLPGLIYAGNHGFEIEAGGRRWVHPAAKKFVRQLPALKARLERELRRPGVFIEDKGLSLSVHYRRLPAGQLPAFKKLFARAVRPWRGLANVTRGKKVFELRPPVAWDKGKAVQWLIKNLKLKAYHPVYIGDDRTDEDAFRALRGRGLTYRVGRPAATAAHFHLKNVAAVYRLLGRLEELPCC